MESLRGWAIPVFILVAGTSIWILTTSPGYGLVVLLGGLLMWEFGRRSRYGRRLRFLPKDRRQARGGPARLAPAAGARAGNRRPLWNRPPGVPAPIRRPPQNRPRRPPPSSGPRRP
jgi:hypothetical protein